MSRHNKKIRRQKTGKFNDADRQVQHEAKVVATFLASGIPDFLMDHTLAILDAACDHVGIAKPADLGGLTGYDEATLFKLFCKTRTVSLSDSELSIAALCAARRRNVRCADR